MLYMARSRLGTLYLLALGGTLSANISETPAFSEISVEGGGNDDGAD